MKATELKKYEVYYTTTVITGNGCEDILGKVTLYAENEKEAEEKFFLTVYNGLTYDEENTLGCMIREIKEVA